MVTFGKKKKFSDYLYTKYGIAFLLIIAVLLTMAVYKRFTVEREMALRHAEAENQKEMLIERKSALEDRVKYLTGDRGTEEEIRKNFDVAKDGEKVIILVGDDANKQATSTATSTSPHKPWYQFW